MVEEWQATAVTEGTAPEQVVDLPGKPGALAGHDRIRYTTRFEDPRDPDDDVATLVLSGLYAHAEVDVTGDRLGGDWPVEHDCYFSPLRIPFRPARENEAVVTCQRPRDRFGGLHDTNLVPPAKRVPGIWWDVALDAHPVPCIAGIEVRPEMTEAGARLHVRTTVVAGGPVEEPITYSLRPEGDATAGGTMERATVDTDGEGVTTVEHTIEVHDPSLWWPRELGRQHRYRLRAKLGESEESVTTGFCRPEFTDGNLRVNGEPLAIRGVNLLTDDRADVGRARDLNATLVRPHAHVPPPDLYEACSESGLLVWQDLPLTGPGTFDPDRGAELARRLTATYGRHPSLAVVTVHGRPVEAFPDGLGGGLLDRLRLRWRAWRTRYDPARAERVASSVPDRWPVVPVVGGPGVPGSVAAYYPGWDYGHPDDVVDLLDRYPAAVVAEFGAGALADGEETESRDPAGIAGFDPGKHDRNVGDGVEASQAYQADTLGRIAELLRQHDVGAITFALRDTDAAGMGVYEQDGTAKAGANALAGAFQPVQVFLTDPGAAKSQLRVRNDLPSDLSTTIEWTAGDRSGELDVTIEQHDRWTGGPIPIPDDAGTVELVLSVGAHRITNEYEL